jgi:HlyD family type I secretion membrane fusion protein
MNITTALTAPSTLTGLLREISDDLAQTRDRKRLVRNALVQVSLVGALFAAWSALAPLDGAVVAPATVKVELNRKTVQHQEGGIVREILVRDGQAVRAGDALLVVANLRADADLAVLRDQWRAARAHLARAHAESQLAPSLLPPQELARDPQAAEHLARELGVFAARRRALDEQVALLHAQLRDTAAQGQGLEAQMDSTGRSASLTDEELALNEQLAKDGFVSRTRVIGLQRLASDYRSRIGEHSSELASIHQRDGELRTRIAQLRLQYQTQGADDLRDATAKLREAEEKLRPSIDQAERQTVRAPVDGVVMGLKVAAAGAVIGPREPLLDVVPAREKLVFDARVAPQDIEHVRTGGNAELRLLGSDARTRAPLAARVVFVAPDRVTEANTGRAWFDVTLEADAVASSANDLRPGMPAEAYINTGERTLLQYLLKPLTLFSQRALREA